MKSQFRLFLLFSFVIVCVSSSASPWDGVTKTAWAVVPGVNDGTAADKPFLIETPEHLAKLAELVNGGQSYAGSYFKLTSNLDLGNKLWTCIGSVNPFSGFFEGDGHTISNLTITKWSQNIGLFGLITSATIQNLGIESGTITCGGSNAGAIVGQSTGAAGNLSYILNCYNKANLVKGATDPRVYMGGIAGLLLNNSMIRHCYNKGNITNDGNASSSNSGGIVGAVAANSTVFSCYSTGVVIGNNIKGGVIGSNWSAASYVFYDSDLCIGTNAATQTIGNVANSTNVKSLTSAEMKLPAFVTTINSGGTTWKVKSGDYPSLPWEGGATGVRTIQNNRISIHSGIKSILIDGAELNGTYSVADISGRIVRKGIAENSSLNIALPNSGIYIVHIGNQIAKVIVR